MGWIKKGNGEYWESELHFSGRDGDKKLEAAMLRLDAEVRKFGSIAAKLCDEVSQLEKYMDDLRIIKHKRDISNQSHSRRVRQLLMEKSELEARLLVIDNKLKKSSKDLSAVDEETLRKNTREILNEANELGDACFDYIRGKESK